MPELIKDLFYSRNHDRFYNDYDIQPFEEWEGNNDFTGLTIHPTGCYLFITHKQAIKRDEYTDGGIDPYWNKNNPGFMDSENRTIECTLQLMDEIGLTDIQSTVILDLACGKGDITSYLKERYSNSTIIGLDISISAIKEAVQTYNNIPFIVADCYSMPFDQGTFDLIVCNNFWEHISDPFLLAKEINYVLKPNGHLILSTPSRYHFENLWSVLVGRKVILQNPTFHFTEYSIGQLKEQLNRSGFSVEKIISKPVSLYRASWKSKLKHKCIKPVIQRLIKLTHSHHILETTAFVLSRKNNF